MNKIKLVILIVVIGAIAVIGVIISIFWRTTTTSLDMASLRARDARITFQLGQQLWLIVVESENFDEMSITNPVIKAISDNIAEHGGELIIQKPLSSIYDFCAYSQLNIKMDDLISWYCIDVSGAKCYLTTDPSATCNQDSYTCSCSF